MQAREAAQTAALTEKTSSRCPRRTSPASSVSTNTVMAMAPLTNDTVLKQGHQQRAAVAARNLGYNSLNGTAWRIEGECTCTVHVGVAVETSLNGGCTRAMDDRSARASWCQHTTIGRPTQYVLSDGDERRRVEGLHVGGAEAVAAVEPGVELVVQLVEVTQVEPRVLRPASRAQHARLLANQLQPQHAAASSATTTARSSVSGNHDSTQQRQRQPRQHAAASAATTTARSSVSGCTLIAQDLFQVTDLFICCSVSCIFAELAKTALY